MKVFFIKFLFIVAALFLISTLRVSLDDELTSLNQQSIFIPPPENIKFMSFGFNEVVADSLWIRWIQNIDSCGKDLSLRSKVVKEKRLAKSGELTNEITKTQKEQVCDQGWAFRMLNAVTDLSPKFRMPYALGASTLSILTEDHIGAKKIYEKAFVNFPNDWTILYRGAYHFLYELNDLPRAAQLLKQAADSGAPEWLYSLSSRVSSQAGKIEFGLRVLQGYAQKVTDPKYKKELEGRIKKLKEKLGK